jgi:hypothetical protein
MRPKHENYADLQLAKLTPELQEWIELYEQNLLALTQRELYQLELKFIKMLLAEQPADLASRLKHEKPSVLEFMLGGGTGTYNYRHNLCGVREGDPSRLLAYVDNKGVKLSAAAKLLTAIRKRSVSTGAPFQDTLNQLCDEFEQNGLRGAYLFNAAEDHDTEES